jgi:hypothetical protein
MKLLLCSECQDVIRLQTERVRLCKCGKVSGVYLNDLDAIYAGDTAIPLGFANSTLVTALRNQPEEGMGYDFKAFIIPKECPTFKKVESITPKRCALNREPVLCKEWQISTFGCRGCKHNLLK